MQKEIEWRKKGRGKDGRGTEEKKKDERKEGRERGKKREREGGREDQIFHSSMLRSYFKSILLSSNNPSVYPISSVIKFQYMNFRRGHKH